MRFANEIARGDISRMGLLSRCEVQGMRCYTFARWRSWGALCSVDVVVVGGGETSHGVIKVVLGNEEASVLVPWPQSSPVETSRVVGKHLRVVEDSPPRCPESGKHFFFWFNCDEGVESFWDTRDSIVGWRESNCLLNIYDVGHLDI